MTLHHLFRNEDSIYSWDYEIDVFNDKPLIKLKSNGTWITVRIEESDIDDLIQMFTELKDHFNRYKERQKDNPYIEPNEWAERVERE